jgi:regulation of enolase protein 1 (concanavalin A-like superfamily)
VDQDIGATGVAGSASFTAGAFTVNASGADIWNRADAFHYVLQPATGDVTVLARVTSVQNTDPWAKAGVMVRESLASNARNVMMELTSQNGLSFQWRAATNGVSDSVSGAAASAPYWVKVVRSGTTLTGYQSVNGTTWTQVGSVSISMNANAYVGLAATSHNNSVLGAFALDSVTVTSP